MTLHGATGGRIRIGLDFLVPEEMVILKGRIRVSLYLFFSSGQL